MPVFRDDDDRAKIARSPGGSRGDYIVRLYLGIPGSTPLYFANVAIERLRAQADTLLRIPPGALEIGIKFIGDGVEVDLRVGRNNSGRVAFLDMTIQAEDVHNARQQAHNIARPLLSQWAFEYGLAIEFLFDEVREVATDVHSYYLGFQGQYQDFDLSRVGGPLIPSTPEIRSLLAAYREGLSLSHRLYQVLALVKVVEGIRRLRVRRLRDAGMSPPKGKEILVETFPNDADAIMGGPDPTGEKWAGNPWLMEAVGQSCESVCTRWTELVRNAIAHLNPFEGADRTLRTDSFEDELSAKQVFPVAKYMARKLLKATVKSPGTESF